MTEKEREHAKRSFSRRVEREVHHLYHDIEEIGDDLQDEMWQKVNKAQKIVGKAEEAIDDFRHMSKKE